jgi:hypothetical protein
MPTHDNRLRMGRSNRAWSLGRHSYRHDFVLLATGSAHAPLDQVQNYLASSHRLSPSVS